MQLKFSDFSASKTLDKKAIASYIPKHLKDTISTDEFIEFVISEYGNLKGWSANDCKRGLINKIGTHPFYNSTVFSCTGKKKNTNLGKIWLVINKKGVGYYDLFSTDPKELWEFSSISDAGYSTQEGFWLKTGSLMRPEKFNFSGNEAAYILDVFSIYRDNFEKSDFQF